MALCRRGRSANATYLIAQRRRSETGIPLFWIIWSQPSESNSFSCFDSALSRHLDGECSSWECRPVLKRRPLMPTIKIALGMCMSAHEMKELGVDLGCLNDVED